ncbi:probable amino acid ABC transporter, permease protein [Pectobacterium atrosepticum SCRI1043]|uniref:Probable amino acid ABC transporter, permease protein n=1 Tax=Pectobacterium atrosepticum (strain SCRI 1043 / ATCC BAA-672) TaxID=218491 RepID=Q6CYM8_PECAS|nr:amino acid ABC transporter permease [Pectobacterium atrosepticum]GKV87920.1 amino acid ABC transporter permease [Pectobacterium carotovorum subsp. carotovorum]ATY92898.1 amino acid ABC transporter permease [Pectobacterium atrosepticum]KFX17489.1 amino acid ABC transporter permease [Pectobacterium atrosepticum]KMK82162.1 amino acid ABC transporter permease [Pectobacterium atrosepticum ICMP 1526]MBL0895023.1 amino acid ABC transporter permease [Pectobacterium atrosepticum]
MFDIFTILRDHGMLLLVGQYPSGPLGGVLCTLLISLLAVLLSFPLGVLVGLARLSPWRWLSWPATCWVYTLRGIPLMMVVFWTYFCVPLLIGHNISGFSTMLCTLVIYESAYIAEIVRGGIQALPSGQYEASRALGMSHLKALRLVILPQALFNSLPSLISQLVSIIKDSTLGYVINVPELTYAANQVSNQLLTKPFQVFAIVALSYYIICFSFTFLANRLESWIANKRLNGQSPSGDDGHHQLFFANPNLKKEAP